MLEAPDRLLVFCRLSIVDVVSEQPTDNPSNSPHHNDMYSHFIQIKKIIGLLIKCKSSYLAAVRSI